ncbi:hypothetical protein SDC9_128967 [bioreactor metagenome]|uniref:Uncharacterized protein n=1 Tax=bioreactor metagenome TaxID=1076179 RepID=A0A645CXJ9_9ZZZZ
MGAPVEAEQCRGGGGDHQRPRVAQDVQDCTRLPMNRHDRHAESEAPHDPTRHKLSRTCRSQHGVEQRQQAPDDVARNHCSGPHVALLILDQLLTCAVWGWWRDSRSQLTPLGSWLGWRRSNSDSRNRRTHKKATSRQIWGAARQLSALKRYQSENRNVEFATNKKRAIEPLSACRCADSA